MRYVVLIALREFLENAKTKGFWITLLIFPVLIFASVEVPMFLEKKVAPDHYFVIVDQSGQFKPVIEEALQRAHGREVIRALFNYAKKNLRLPTSADKSSLPKLDPEQLPLPKSEVDDLLNTVLQANPEGLEQFSRLGGKAFVLKKIRPFLRKDAPPFEEPRQRFHQVALPSPLSAQTALGTLSAQLKPYLRGDRLLSVQGRKVKLDTAILIPPHIDDILVRPSLSPSDLLKLHQGVEYWSANLADRTLRDQIENGINEEVRRREYARHQVDPRIVRTVQHTHARFLTFNPLKAAGKEKVSLADYIRQWAPSGFVYLLWISIFTVSQMLLNNTIEEKSNRIIEVLLSSVTPGELMIGKLAGIAAVGFTMIGVWVSFLLGMVAWKAGPESELARQLLLVLRHSHLLPAFAFYFLTGYLIYASLIMALGSLCNTLKEAQNFMGVIVVILMVPLLTLMFIPKDPNGTLATILSWIPLYTPFVMMNRINANLPAFDLIGTTVLLLFTAAFALWFAGRVFRLGVLRTGQPPKLWELLRWLRRERKG